MEEEANTSIILGWPFLATAGAIMDVPKGELVLRLHEEKMVFNVFKEMSYPKESIGECMMADTIEQIVQGVLEEEQCEGTMELEQQASSGELPPGTMENSIMLNPKDNKEMEAPKLELKTLPPSLKYAYLGDNNTYPCADGILRRCISHEEGHEVLWQCHGSAYRGHYSGERTVAKVLQCGFYWPTIFKDAKDLVSRCDECQSAGNLPKRNEMSQRFIMELELFDVWGINFMGPSHPPTQTIIYWWL
ncbi:uncharacterized protein LOC107633177 [Arachis ipaensis]|uniref:uncharacterized protein LOC107633177 n=1 Tax=Arachis ipaensis TaxID=130454 RepID=UPI0007AFAEDB|nr:uncharacterized protein LOC107633177 [Arachis ipaensis]